MAFRFHPTKQGDIPHTEIQTQKMLPLMENNNTSNQISNGSPPKSKHINKAEKERDDI